jgi:hypothetical protein
LTQFVARIEQSKMQERPTPDFAALNPGYARFRFDKPSDRSLDSKTARNLICFGACAK